MTISNDATYKIDTIIQDYELFNPFWININTIGVTKYDKNYKPILKRIKYKRKQQGLFDTYILTLSYFFSLQKK